MRSTYRRLCVVCGTALCLMMVGGCGKHVWFNSDQPEGEEGAEVEVSLSAEFGAGHATSRADAAMDSQLNSNIGRLNLKDIRVVFYATDAAGDPTVVAQVVDWKTQIYRGKVQGTDKIRVDESSLRVSLDGIESIKVDDYVVLLFTSPSSSLLQSTEVGMAYSELLKEQQYVYSQKQDDIAANLGFCVYSNINSPTRVTKGHLLKYQAQGKPFPINISNLEPVNAYLYVQWSNDLSFNGYACSKRSDSKVKVYFDAQNRKYYLAPKYDESDYDGSTGSPLTEYKVPKDPNYDISSDADQSILDSHFIYLEKAKNTVYTYSPVEHLSGGVDCVLPIAENTLSSMHVTGKVATRAAIGLPMVPRRLSSKDTSAENTKLSFFVFSNIAYHRDELSKLYTDARTATQPESWHQSLIDEVRKLNEAFGLSPDGGVPEESVLDRGYDSLGLSYYHEGVSYYLHVFRPQYADRITEVDKPGRYGIIRNQLYNIRITKISKLGCADPNTLFRDRTTEYNHSGSSEIGFQLSESTVVNIDKEW